MRFLINVSLVSIFILMISTGKAQSLNLGVKGGINYASISNIDQDSRLGLTGGAFVGVKFNTLALQTEFLFSQQGGKFNQNDIETDYLLIPVILKLHFLKIFNLQAGPQFSYLINDSNLLVSEQLDISGAAGLGLNLGNLSIDMRYNYGFTDAFKGASGKNRFISVALGISFL